MSDEADRADHHINSTIELGVMAARKKANIDTSNSSGECWECGEEVGNDRRWCSFEHMKLWEQNNE